MIYLILAIASSVMISIIMRVSEKYVKNEMGMFMANYVICMVLSFMYMQDKTQLYMLATRGGSLTAALGVISGVLYLVNFVFLKFNMKHNGIVMSSTFMKLGVLVPTIMAIVVFHELPRATQVVGILLAVAAIILINFEKDALSESKHKLWLLLLLLLSGFTDSMANVFDKMADAGMKDGYLLVTFGTAFAVALALALMGRNKVTAKELLFGTLIGIPNYFSARFLILALERVEAVLVYPMYSVATIIIITVVGMVAFREKVGAKKLCALGLIMLALVLLNV